jgi:ABC-type phosphate transport system permease subunit
VEKKLLNYIYIALNILFIYIINILYLFIIVFILFIYYFYIHNIYKTVYFVTLTYFFTGTYWESENIQVHAQKTSG